MFYVCDIASFCRRIFKRGFLKQIFIIFVNNEFDKPIPIDIYVSKFDGYDEITNIERTEEELNFRPQR